MPNFERRGARPGPRSAEPSQASSRLEAARQEAERLKALRAYRGAQLEELLPDLEAEARHQVDEDITRLDLEAARLSEADAEQIGVREAAHARALNALTACRERIAAKDTELRHRFGIPDDVRRI